MKLTERTFSALLAAFRAPEPTPGGGSASAVAAAVGASLLAMVAGIPKPRATTEQDLKRLEAAGARCSELSARLAELIDRDSEAYELVVAAYRLPKATDAEKEARGVRIQQALRAAIEAPLEVMHGCSDSVEQAAIIAAYGNRNASSDVQVGLELLGAGMRGAKLNVEINLGSVKDHEYAARTRAASEEMIEALERGVAAARTRLTEAL